MNFNYTNSDVEGDVRMGTITLSERNIEHLIKASALFDGVGMEPNLQRLCEDGTMLVVTAVSEGLVPVFESRGNVVSATVPVDLLSTLGNVTEGQSTHDAYLQGETLWVLVAQSDDEHYERREPGPGFHGIV